MSSVVGNSTSAGSDSAVSAPAVADFLRTARTTSMSIAQRCRDYSRIYHLVLLCLVLCVSCFPLVQADAQILKDTSQGAFTSASLLVGSSTAPTVDASTTAAQQATGNSTNTVVLTLPKSSAATSTLDRALRISVTNIINDFVNQACTAYELIEPDFVATVSTTDTSIVTPQTVKNNGYDFSVMETNVAHAASVSQDQSVSSLRAYPIALTALVPFYRLPDSSGLIPLVVSPLVLCGIFRGAITYWNDSSLQALNPNLPLPAHQILLLFVADPNESNMALSSLCSKVDPNWNLGVSTTLNPPGQYYPMNTLDDMMSAVIDTVYSFGLGNAASAVGLGVKMAKMTNRNGEIVEATTLSISSTFLELNSAGYKTGANSFDLTDPYTSTAWPLVLTHFLVIDSQASGLSCAAKRGALNFILWLLGADVVSRIASAASIVVIPALYMADSDMLAEIKTQIQCEGNNLISTDTTAGFIVGNAALSNSLALYSNLYTQVDSQLVFQFSVASDSMTLNRLHEGEIDVGTQNAYSLTDDDIGKHLNSADGGYLMPTFLAGAKSIFNLPAALTSLYTRRLTNDSISPNLPPLYPLYADLELLAQVFSGVIDTWDHPLMLKHNPQLSDWIDACPTIDLTVRVVVCCTDPNDPQVATTMFTQALSGTDYVQSSKQLVVEYLRPDLTLWDSIVKYSGAGLAQYARRYYNIDTESRLALKVHNLPGAISFGMIVSATSNPQTDFMLVHTTSEGIQEALPPQPSSIRACADAMLSRDVAIWNNPYLRTWTSAASGCYPLTLLLHLSIKKAYANSPPVTDYNGYASSVRTGGCARVKQVLSFISWLQSDDTLATASENSGFVRITDNAYHRSVMLNELNSVTCDGSTVLVILPQSWVINSSITGVVTALASIALAGGVASLIVLYLFKHRTVIRSASPIFQAVILIGLMLLAISMIFYVQPTSKVYCGLFQWFANIGFMLTFSPLAVKTWRIYRIFSRKRLLVVKISNNRLGLIIGSMIAIDLLILSIWQGVSPLQPLDTVQDAVNEFSPVHIYRHCSVDDQGMKFLIVEAVYKALVIVGTAMMAFSVRQVSSTYNDSQAIAWAVYNICFTGVIVAAILAFVKAIGDTMIILVMFLFVWMVYVTYAFLFGPKFLTLFSKDAANAESASRHSMETDKHGFSFATVIDLSPSALAPYQRALEEQLDKVRARMNQLGIGPDGKADASKGEKSILDDRPVGQNPSAGIVSEGPKKSNLSTNVPGPDASPPKNVRVSFNQSPSRGPVNSMSGRNSPIQPSKIEFTRQTSSRMQSKGTPGETGPLLTGTNAMTPSSRSIAASPPATRGVLGRSPYVPLHLANSRPARYMHGSSLSELPPGTPIYENLSPTNRINALRYDTSNHEDATIVVAGGDNVVAVAKQPLFKPNREASFSTIPGTDPHSPKLPRRPSDEEDGMPNVTFHPPPPGEASGRQSAQLVRTTSARAQSSGLPSQPVILDDEPPSLNASPRQILQSPRPAIPGISLPSSPSLVEPNSPPSTSSNATVPSSGAAAAPGSDDSSNNRKSGSNSSRKDQFTHNNIKSTIS